MYELGVLALPSYKALRLHFSFLSVLTFVFAVSASSSYTLLPDLLPFSLPITFVQSSNFTFFTI